MIKRVLVVAAFSVASLLAVDFAAEGKLWWEHIQFLADDNIAGRDTGSEGFHKAVSYVSTAFERSGLKPAGASGYLQPVKFDQVQLIAEQSSLTLLQGSETLVLEPQDAVINPRSEAREIEAPLVFAGYGMAVPEVHFDETEGLDLKGKIAVYVSGPAPVEASGNIKSHYASAVERWATLKRAGAVGVAVIPPPQPIAATGRGASADGAGRGGRALGNLPAIQLAERALQETAGQSISIGITPRGAEKFFAASGHTFDEIEKLARVNAPLPKFPMNATLRARVAVTHTPMEAPNVVGLLPGSDRKLKGEYVIMSAHLDHLGSGRAVNGDSIYNGAMDDASGIASVLEIARLMKEGNVKPKRSIVFLAVTAEEKGELGSRYFAAHPTVSAKHIVADINLDMFLPLYALKVIEVQGLSESSLGEQIRTAAEAFGVAVQTDREPEQNRFIRSDQYSFIRRGIPSLAFKFGYDFGSPDEQIRRNWVRDRYHKPSDDLTQPVDSEAAAKFNRIIMTLLQKVAADPRRPQWNQDSFFRRFAAQ